MQQTQNYKLNLIETDDPFSPVPLNENAQKIEAALDTLTTSAQTEAASRVETDTALDSRVTALEAKKVVVGTYQGIDISAINISLGFRPVAVFLFRPYSPETWILTSAHPTEEYWHITDSGFSVDAYTDYSNNHMNCEEEVYLYIAFC